MFSDSKFRFFSPHETVLTHADERTPRKCFSGAHLPFGERTSTVPKAATGCGRSGGAEHLAAPLARGLPGHKRPFLRVPPLAPGPASWRHRGAKQMFTCGVLGFSLG